MLGFPDTTHDAVLFAEKSERDGESLVAALREIGFAIDDDQAAQIRSGKDLYS